MEQQYSQHQPVLPALPPNQYSAEHYQFLASLIEAKSAHRLFDEIATRNYSAQTVLAFHRVILAQFDKNVILAYNVDVRSREIDCEIALNLMVVECHESDTQMPSFLNDQMAIKIMFGDFASRSQNARERDQILRTEYGISSPQNAPRDESGILPHMR
jgi:hypothetical protein